MISASLEDEAARMSNMLRGKTVEIIRHHRSQEVTIEFSDGTRLFVNKTDTGLDFSITDGIDSSTL
jgi:hypothetical protein